MQRLPAFCDVALSGRGAMLCLLLWQNAKFMHVSYGSGSAGVLGTFVIFKCRDNVHAPSQHRSKRLPSPQ